MIELVLSESAAGWLQSVKPEYEIYPLTLALDMGSLDALDILTIGRLSALEWLYGDFEGVAQELARSNMKALQRLQQAKEARLWVVPWVPGEICGLYFLCSLLPEETDRLSVIFYFEQEGDTDSHTVWDIAPVQLDALLASERLLTAEERQRYAREFDALLTDQTQLRAFVHGNLCNVPEDHYDETLRSQMPDGPFPAALVIGRTLPLLPGVSDRWLYLRLMEMVKRGELRMIRPGDDDSPYSGVYQRA